MSTLASRAPDATEGIRGPGRRSSGSSRRSVMVPPITLRSPLVPIVLGLVAVTIGLRLVDPRRAQDRGATRSAAGAIGLAIGLLATRSSVENLDSVVVWGALVGATLRYATPLVFASLGGLFSERSRRREHRPRGDDADRARSSRSGARTSPARGRWAWRSESGPAALFGLLHAFFSITLRADQIVGGTAINLIALGLTTYLFIKIYGTEGTPTGISSDPERDHRLSRRGSRARELPRRRLRSAQPHDLGRVRSSSSRCGSWSSRRRSGCASARWASIPRAADTVGINVYAVRYGAVILSGALAAARRRVPLARLRRDVRPEHDRRARVHRARRADLRELATVRRSCRVPPVRLLERALRQPPDVLDVGLGHCSRRCRTLSRSSPSPE